MASVAPSFISEPIDPKWVVEISEILNHQLKIDSKTPLVSIYQLPETITSHKPEAYEPQQLGLGPIHHFRSEPYSKMEQKKLAVMQSFLKYHQIKDFELTVLDKVMKLVPAVRACYDMFLKDDNSSLAWVFTIDGVFLLNLFETHSSSQTSNVDPRKRSLAQDIMMLENQIPFVILKEINEGMNPSSCNNILSPSIFRSFCEIHSPLELCSPSQAPNHSEHLLHYMYHSIINNIPVIIIPMMDLPSVGSSFPGLTSTVQVSDLVTSMMDLPSVGSSFPGLTSIVQVSDLVKKVPQKEIVQVYEQTITILQNFSKQNVNIPSASKLKSKSGYMFEVLPEHGGIKKIDIVDKKIYLPCLTLNTDSEVILRNLVSYETLMPNNNHFPLTEYMGLMCGLIVKVEDVKLLKQEKIINGELGVDEIVKLFVGMSGSIVSKKTKEKSELQDMIEEVNKVYESTLKMKAYLLLKKLAKMLLVVLTDIGGFVGDSWKIVAFMCSIVTMFMLTYQAYCDVYGCEKTNVTLLSYT